MSSPRCATLRLPIIAKLTPNVTSIADIAKAAAEAGADAISLINTVLGMAVDWRRRAAAGQRHGRPERARRSSRSPCGASIKLRTAVKIAIIGIGGIATIDDVMEFLVAGATAVQIGTANFYDPTVSMKCSTPCRPPCEAGVASVQELVGALPLALPISGTRQPRLAKFRRARRSRGEITEKPGATMRVLSGIQPTGRFHWGNYFGAIRQYIDLQHGNEAYYFIANLHALTTVREPQVLQQLHARRGPRSAGPGPRPRAGHAVRAVRRARGVRAVLAADDRRADGPARAVPRLTRTRRPRDCRPTRACSPIPC